MLIQGKPPPFSPGVKEAAPSYIQYTRLKVQGQPKEEVEEGFPLAICSLIDPGTRALELRMMLPNSRCVHSASDNNAATTDE